MKLLIALGGNALLERGQSADYITQQKNVKKSVLAIATAIKNGHRVVLCHGNGPQIGLLSVKESAHETALQMPLDVLSAQCQGMIGYLLQQALQDALQSDKVATILTQVVVNNKDPQWQHPDKFIGRCLDTAAVTQLEQQYPNWTFQKDGPYWRRVIASPQPLNIIETSAIQALLEQGITPICAGGGGIPVTGSQGRHGAECVVDKDLTAAMLAQSLHVDKMIILTDVLAVMKHFGSEKQTPIYQTDDVTLSAMHFPAGSMGPKVSAACQFVRQQKKPAAIGHTSDLIALIEGTKGTQIWPHSTKTL